MLKIFRRKQPATLGEWGEVLARKEYRRRGYTILGSNVFNRTGKRVGEIDFIARDKSTLVFVEVKTRTRLAHSFGTAAEAVDVFKQTRLLKIIKLFLLKHSGLQHLRPQIDVCVIEVGVDPSTDLRVKPDLSAMSSRPNGQGRRLDKVDYFVTIIPNAVEDETR